MVKEESGRRLVDADKPKTTKDAPFVEQSVACLGQKALVLIKTAEEDLVGAFKARSKDGAVCMAMLLISPATSARYLGSCARLACENPRWAKSEEAGSE